MARARQAPGTESTLDDVIETLGYLHDDMVEIKELLQQIIPAEPIRRSGALK